MEKRAHKSLLASLGASKSELLTSAVDIFTMPFVDTSLEDSYTSIVLPNNRDSNSSVVEFTVEPMSDYYVSMFATLMYMEFHVTKHDGSSRIGVDEDVSFITLPASSLFNLLEVFVNDRQVVALGNSQLGYKTYIEHMLSYSDSTIHGHLQAAQCVVDTPGKLDSKGPVRPLEAGAAAADRQFFMFAGNGAFVANHLKMVGDGKKIAVLCQPAGDIFAMEKVFPPKTKIMLRFHRNRDSFFMRYEPGANTVEDPAVEYRPVIDRIELRVKHMKLSEKVANYHRLLFESQNLSAHPFKHTEIKAFAFPAGTQNINVGNVHKGDIPKSLFVVMVDTAAFNGEPNYHPYNFQDFGCIRARAILNGVSYPDHQGYTPNRDLRYLEEWVALNRNVGIGMQDAANQVNNSFFTGGFFCLSFQFCGVRRRRRRIRR